MKNFHYVYLLSSINHPGSHYSGITQDLEARLKKHNAGDCVHTSKFTPWRIETAIAFSSKEEALAFEKYLKSGSGREFALRHF